MPQLTWAKDLCPRTVRVVLEWDQLTNSTRLSIYCDAQDKSFQGAMEADVSGLEWEAVCDAVHSALMVWNDSTPGECMRHAATLIRQTGHEAVTTLR